MKTSITYLGLAALLAIASQAQQSPSPQTASVQAQVAPCAGPSSPSAQGNNPTFKTPNRWKQVLDKQRQQLQGLTGISVPDPTKPVEQTVNAKPAPCPAKSVTPGVPAAQSAPAPHLPAGVITTWLCNPIITSTDPSHTTTFITPDALTNAEPAQPSVFEADGAKADPKATVSCASLRRDPKNNKVFLAQ